MNDPANRLFDCNSHPTVDGTWPNTNSSCKFNDLKVKLIDEGFCGAAAVGLPGVGSYDDDLFIKQCHDWNWIPVAAWNPDTQFPPEKRIFELNKIGYKGIKIHPRLMGRILSVPDLVEIFKSAHKNQMCVMLCSYPCFSSKDFEPFDMLALVQRALHESPSINLMLMHSGGFELIKYIEFARANPQVVLDLSFTLMKYSGSSVDLDIAYAFNNFDKRIVIGSDYPEFDISSVRSRFQHFSKNLDNERKQNIAWRNAYKFFGIQDNE